MVVSVAAPPPEKLLMLTALEEMKKKQTKAIHSSLTATNCIFSKEQQTKKNSHQMHIIPASASCLVFLLAGCTTSLSSCSRSLLPFSCLTAPYHHKKEKQQMSAKYSRYRHLTTAKDIHSPCFTILFFPDMLVKKKLQNKRKKKNKNKKLRVACSKNGNRM